MKSPLTQNITANGQSIVFDVRNYNTVKFMPKGTFAGANVTFEGSLDYGVTWVTLQVVRSNANTVETTSGVLGAAPAYYYRTDVSGITDFRIRSTAFTSGTQVWIVTGSVAQTDVIQPTLATVALGAGSASIGTVATPAGTALSVVSTASTNASSQKATAGNLFEVSVSNPTATPAYVKFYNKASAPTVGTDVPVLTIVAPATSATQIPTAINLTFSQIGKRFSTGIAIAITAGPLATDTAVAVAGVQVHGTYV